MSSAYRYSRLVMAIASGTLFMRSPSRCFAAGRTAPRSATVSLRAGIPGSRSLRSWLLPPQEEYVSEECAGAATAAQRDLGAFHLHRRAPAAQLLHAADHPLEELHGRAPVTERHQPAVGGDRVPAAGSDHAAHHVVTALALAAEAER